MSEKLQNYFETHRGVFFSLNLIFIMILLISFQQIAYPKANFSDALSIDNRLTT